MKGKAITAAVALAAGLVFGSAALVDKIGEFEDGGAKAFYVVYADKLAAGLPTGCRGITPHITDTPMKVGDVWSKAKCDVETARALAKVQTALIRCFRAIPPQSVFDAATSFAWNVGVAAACNSGAMRAWNEYGPEAPGLASSWFKGCRRLFESDDGRPVWSYVKTGRKLASGKPEMKFVRGLANRREAEFRYCIGYRS